jgi:hypothetical protein
MALAAFVGAPYLADLADTVRWFAIFQGKRGLLPDFIAGCSTEELQRWSLRLVCLGGRIVRRRRDGIAWAARVEANAAHAQGL